MESGLKKYKNTSWFIGKVKYLSQKAVEKRAIEYGNKFFESNQDKTAAEAILIKRSSFSHEEEVRVLVIDRNNRSKNGVLKVKIDPHQIIDSILVDSRASNEWLEVYSHYLKNVIGFQGRVAKSTLYNPIERIKINRKRY